MPRILCLNGPNLDQLGWRDPAIYGDWTLAHLEQAIKTWASELDFDVVCRQSNHEGEMIEAIHSASDLAGVIVNPGALTHSSPALGDAVAACPAPVVEVHLSNIRGRDRWRRRSYLSSPAVRSIVGRGPEGYRAALRHLSNRAAWAIDTIRYGPHPDHQVDLRRVAASPAGVILVHGGFWMDNWASDTVEAWAVDLARRGLPSAVIEYRRLGSGGGAVPTTADVTDAARAAISALDLERFGIVGHSSGGHLAAGAVAHGHIEPVVTVAVAGIFDVAAAHAAGVGGGAPGRFDPTSSTSPINMEAPPGALALVHGEADDVVPPSQTVAYAQYLDSRGSSPQVDLIPDCGHFDALDPQSSAWATVVERLTAHLI